MEILPNNPQEKGLLSEAPNFGAVNNDEDLPENSEVVIQFLAAETFARCGATVRVPTSITIEELGKILIKLKKTVSQSSEDLPEDGVYNFYIGDTQQYQIVENLETTLKQWNLTVETLVEKLFEGHNIIADAEKHRISSEIVIPILFEPQAIFRVLPVTRCSSTLPGHDSVVTCVRFSPDGETLASGGGDCHLKLWDMCTELPSSNGVPASVRPHTRPIQVLEWSVCGRRLASGDMGGCVCVWQAPDLQVNRPNWTLMNERRLVRANAPKTERLRWVRAMSWRPLHIDSQSRLLAVGYQDGGLVIWDVALSTVHLTLAGHSECVSSLRWGGSDLLYSGSHDHSLRVWRAVDGVLCRTMKTHAHWVNCMSLSVDSALRTGWLDPRRMVSEADFVARNQALVSSMDREPANCTHIQSLARQYYECVRADQPERLVVGSDDKTLSLWEPELHSKPVNARMTGHMAVVNDVRFSPDSRIIASASFDKSIKLWDGRTGGFLCSLLGHVQDAYLVAWSPDSRLLISASKDSTLQVFSIMSARHRQTSRDQSTGKMRNLRHHLHNLFGHADQVFAVDWSPTGQKVASAGADCVLKIWRA